MKPAYAPLWLLASTVTAVAVPEAASSASPQALFRSDDGPTNLTPGPVNAAAAAGQTKCFLFAVQNYNWYYALTGVWGTRTGTFASARGSGSAAKICVPYASTGGAMYIGPHPNPGPGSTKLECNFPINGNTAYCDMSLVDGYSLSVLCGASSGSGGQTIAFGGTKDLWKTGQPCVDKSAISQGICKNDEGYAPSQSQVTAFFQEGVRSTAQSQNNYCIWKNCPIQSFPITYDVSCFVVGTAKP